MNPLKACIVSQILLVIALIPHGFHAREGPCWVQHPFTFSRRKMKLFWIYRSLQAGIVASAALSMLPAGAQTPAPDMPAPAAAPTAQSAPAQPRLQHRAQRAEQRGQRPSPSPRRGHRGANGEPANVDRLAQDRGATEADYQLNAMARCNVFKAPDERKACMERMRQAPQGDVQGGGYLREYSYEVPVNGS